MNTDQALMDRLLLRPSEVATTLGIGRSKTYELIAGGIIPSIRIGGSVRVPLDALRQWLDRQSTEHAEVPQP